jgi:hypothetical protein
MLAIPAASVATKNTAERRTHKVIELPPRSRCYPRYRSALRR